MANALWRLGGRRSLILWEFVIHGCIDGYSRRIIFLHCSTNNLSPTVLGLFDSAIVIAMFFVTSPIVINVPIRGLLAVETMHAITQWLANLNIKINMTSMFVNKKHRYRTRWWSWPSRIKGDYHDYGVSNTAVRHTMVADRGRVGSLTRNQKIERVWRDVFRCVCDVFYYTFYAMEQTGFWMYKSHLHVHVAVCLFKKNKLCFM